MTTWQNRIVGSGEEAPDQLVANPRNWRIHPKAQQEALAGALDQVGWVQQIIVNRRTGMLVDGHLRVELALSRGEPSVPVVYVDLSPEEEGIVLASIDPISAMAGRDDEKLRQLLAEVSFDSKALEDALTALAPMERGGLTDPDDVPEVDGADVYVKPGDLWLLGDHRLLCGDSTRAEDVARLMDGEVADALFSSPPYLQQRDYNGNMAPDWHALMVGVFRAQMLAPSAQVFVNLGPVHRDGRVVRYWDGWIDAMESDGWPLFGWYVWDKLEAMPGDWNGRLGPAHEFVFHFTADPTRPRKTVPTKGGGQVQKARTQRNRDGSVKAFTQQNVPMQMTKIPDSVIRLTPQKGGVSGHVAPFPVGLPSLFMEAYPGDVWAEPFSGSGTTIIAAETLGRRCYAMELEPRYVQVAIERWQQFTGKEAVRDGSHVAAVD